MKPVVSAATERVWSPFLVATDVSTTYLDPTILELNETVNRDAVDRMKVSQVEKNKEILNTTE